MAQYGIGPGGGYTPEKTKKLTPAQQIAREEGGKPSAPAAAVTAAANLARAVAQAAIDSGVKLGVGSSAESIPGDWNPGDPIVSDGNAADSSGGTSSNPTAPGYNPDFSQIDFSQYFKMWGLPADVQARIEQIFRANYANTDVAAQIALHYIRTTDWYGQTYPGIQIAEAKGLIQDEQGYRSLLNQQTAVYRQYLGRDITSDEFAANLTEGVNNTIVGQRLQGAVYAKTYGGDWNYALGAFSDTADYTPSDMNTLGQEKAGLDTPLGQMLQRRLDLANQRLQGVFKGGLATPSMSLAGGKLAGLKAGASPDIAAL